MANRTRPDLVLALVPHLETGFDAAPFIAQAHRIIERVLVGPGNETDETVLADLETYLAAHLIAVIRPPLASESGTGVSGSYARGQMTKGLDSTPPGQICRSLDATGLLASALLGKQPFIFETFGT
jgi:hypothetical protein